MYNKKLDPELDLNDYFDSGDYELLFLGDVSLPSGQLIVADPLYSLPYGGTAPFAKRVKSGKYPAVLAVCDDGDGGFLYLAAKLMFTKAEAVRFQLALKPNEDPRSLGEDEIYGYPVETGLASFCDAKTQQAYARFCKQWKKENPGRNLYDDYFAALFAQSYEKNPKHQGASGDWLNWTMPGQEGNILLFNSGFGGGVYPSYWGYDRNGNVCCLVTPFISPAELEE